MVYKLAKAIQCTRAEILGCLGLMSLIEQSHLSLGGHLYEEKKENGLKKHRYRIVKAHRFRNKKSTYCHNRYKLVAGKATDLYSRPLFPKIIHDP